MAKMPELNWTKNLAQLHAMDQSFNLLKYKILK